MGLIIDDCRLLIEKRRKAQKSEAGGQRSEVRKTSEQYQQCNNLHLVTCNLRLPITDNEYPIPSTQQGDVL